MSNRFFRGKRTRRRGELLRNKPDLTNEDERCTLVHVSKRQEVTTLGIYTSEEEAQQELQKSEIVTGTLHIFSNENRVLYSEERGD